MAQSKKKKKNTPIPTPAAVQYVANKAQTTYSAWTDHFASQVRSILNQVNRFEKELTETEIQLIANFSYDFMERSPESPQTFGLHYLTKNRAYTHVGSLPQKNGPKTVVFVTGIFPGAGHGGGLRALDMIEELALKGHEVILYTTPPREGDEASFKHLKKVVSKIKIVEYVEMNQEVFHQWVLDFGKVLDAVYYVWPTTAPLIFKKHDFIREQIFEFIEVTVRRIWMDLVSYVREHQFHLVPAKLGELWMCYHWEKTAVVNSSHLVCLTDKDMEFVQNVFGAKEVHIIPTGISRFVVLNDLEKYKNIKAIPLSAGFIGHFDHYPNKDGVRWYLENVHPHVLKKVPNYTLHVMGKGNLQELKAQFPQFSKSIKWVGEIDNVVQSLKKMEICVTPLINGAGLRGKVNQYAAMEKAFVSTSIGVCGTSYENGKSALIADEPLKFAEDVIQLLTNEKMRTDLARNAKEVIHHHTSWEKPIQDLEALF